MRVQICSDARGRWRDGNGKGGDNVEAVPPEEGMFGPVEGRVPSRRGPMLPASARA